MQPINSKPLVKYGETFQRLGNTVRVSSYDSMKHLEKAILDNGFLPASADVSPIQPPFFTEFTYTDVLGGMLLRTFSAEINNRMVLDHHPSEISDELKSKFIQGISDKYQLKKYVSGYKNIVFIPGHNIFDQVVDHQQLFKIMDSADDVVIKPHPISNESILRSLGQSFGYKRILDKDLSGVNLVLQCQNVYSVSTSEIPIVAMMNNINFHDITQYLNSHIGALSHIINKVKNSSNKKEEILSLLLAEDSGFIMPCMDSDEIYYRISKYCMKALKHREIFKMTTPQRLSIHRPSVMSPPAIKEVQKNEIQQINK